MNRSLAQGLTLALAFALAACGGSGSQASSKKGPYVAKGNGVAISAEEFKARLDEQSPFVRQRFAELEAKKQFLDNLVRFELLANEAQKAGLDKDPEVQLMMKRVMVQKLVQKRFAQQDTGADIPEADLKAYYDQHKDEYQRAGRVRVAQVFFAAKEGTPERAAKEAAAKKALAKIRAEEKKNPAVFQTVARESSEDETTKNLGGDLGFKSADELSTQYSKPFADAAFALQQDQVSDVVASPVGFHILKRVAFQDELNRPFDQVKPQIAAKLARERRSKAFDDEIARLRKAADVKVDDAELAKIQIAPGGAEGMMGGMGGGMMGGMRMGGRGMSPHGAVPPGSAMPAQAPAGAAPAAPVPAAPAGH